MNLERQRLEGGRTRYFAAAVAMFVGVWPLRFAEAANVRDIWGDTGSGNLLSFAKNTSSVFPLNGDVDERLATCGGTTHICGQVAYFDVVFDTFYWEHELRMLMDACQSQPTPGVGQVCDDLRTLLDKLHLPYEAAQPNDVPTCAICDAVADATAADSRPVAVIPARGVLAIPEALLETTDLPVMLSVGFGALPTRIEEAAAFALANDAIGFVVIPPGEVGDYEPTLSQLLTSTSTSQVLDLDFADTICAPPQDPEAAPPPMPCLFFRDLGVPSSGTEWKFDANQSAWESAWQAVAPVASLPYAGPLEFQTSDHHDLVDTFPYPQDAWFYRAAFAMLRAATLIEEMSGPSGTPTIPVDGQGVAGIPDGDRMGIAGVSRGGIVTLLVNGVDDRFKAAVVGSAGGFFAASYDDNPLVVEIDDLDAPFGASLSQPNGALCAYPTQPSDPSDSEEWDAFENPFRPSNAVTRIYEEGEIDEIFWAISCSLGTPDGRCAHENLYDPAWNDDGALKHAQLARLFCDQDFDAGLSSALMRPLEADVVAEGGYPGVNYNPAQIDRRTCAPPKLANPEGRQDLELIYFMSYLDPYYYVFNDPGPLDEQNPQIVVPEIYQHAPLLLIAGAQDQIFPINTVSETFRLIRETDLLVSEYLLQEDPPRSRSVLQFISNWDHPAFYLLPAVAVNAQRGMELTGLASAANRTSGLTGFTEVTLGGVSHHPYSDYMNLNAFAGVDETPSGGSPLEIHPRLDTAAEVASASQTTERFFAVNVAGGSTPQYAFEPPEFVDNPTIGSPASPYHEIGDLIVVTAQVDLDALVASDFLPSGYELSAPEVRLAISFDRGWTYNGMTFYANPWANDTNAHGDVCYDGQGGGVLENELCFRTACTSDELSETNPLSAAFQLCQKEIAYCREPYPMTEIPGHDGVYTTATGASDVNRIEKPANYDVDDVVYFVEVNFQATHASQPPIQLYFTSLPAVPPDGDRRLDITKYDPRAYYFTENLATDGKIWFRPRLRAFGGIGPASGDTCCSFPGEIVRAQSWPWQCGSVGDAILASGDAMGDGCDRFAPITGHTVGLAEMRDPHWVGMDGANAFGFLRAPQLADNDRNGVGNPCENPIDETGNGIPNGIPDSPCSCQANTAGGRGCEHLWPAAILALAAVPLALHGAGRRRKAAPK